MKNWFTGRFMDHSPKKCTNCRDYKLKGAYRKYGIFKQHWWCSDCIARHETPTPDQAAREAGL
jgi:hypothetical protein